MPDERCDRMASMIMSNLATGAPLAEDWRTHVSECATCSDVCRRAGMLAASLEQVSIEKETKMNELIEVAAQTTRAAHRRRIFWQILGVGLLGAAAVKTWHEVGTSRYPYIATAIFMTLIGLPMFLIWWNARGQEPRRLYKRLTGREVSGVCRGIADSLHAPVWAVRVVFIMFAWLISGWFVIAAYLILDLVLPIHPEDRDKMIRFRISRWFRRRFAAA